MRSAFPSVGNQITQNPAQADENKIDELEGKIPGHQPVLTEKFCGLIQKGKVDKAFKKEEAGKNP